eukprot:7647740-Pyramimonas_sp.AAC.1
MVLKHTYSRVLIFSDYLPVVRGFRKPRELLQKSDMLDLRVELWRVLDAREGEIDLRWTKSHPTAFQVQQLGLARIERMLNAAADGLAAEAAQRGAIPSEL